MARKIINWAKRAEKIRKFEKAPFRNTVNFNKAHKQWLRYRWEKYRHISVRSIRKISKGHAELLRSAGFMTAGDAVVLDQQKDFRGNKIKGIRTTFTKSGVIVESIKDRRDYLVSLTKAERLAIVKGPAKEKIIEILKNRKIWAQIKRAKKYYFRLQFGAHAKTQAFSPDAISAYFSIEDVISRRSEPDNAKIKKWTALRVTAFYGKKGKTRRKRRSRNRSVSRRKSA